ncbi:universal stress protein [Flammeovirgaceae bacterium SG7u.111]|nr:universal stress protein [Flammeovirgaceae bacterium SG7u.132]WPO34958.1 universal stress protein [Flammeovirgaceae bacterium SG7u.111]
MYALKTILVALDLTSIDNYLVRYALNYSKLLDLDKIVFVYVVQGVNLKEKVTTPDGNITKKEEIATKLKNEVDKSISEAEPGLEFVFSIKSGGHLNAILSEAQKHDAGQILVGRKNLAEGPGRLSKRLARRALCSVLTVPDKSEPDFKKILVPVDFSEHSHLAVERSISVAKKHNLELQCMHIYNLPNGYLASGKSKEEFSKIMKSNAQKRWNHFLSEIDTQGMEINCKFFLDMRANPAKLIYNTALIEHVDMIILGSRGRTNVAAAFIGSTTEKLLGENMSIPTLVVKNRTYNLGFFDALLNF